MYEQFYNFIAELVIDFFRKNEIKPGAKYDIRLPNEAEVVGLYEELGRANEADTFEYQMAGQNPYETSCLIIGQTRVIIATTAGHVTDAFLTNLRNKVGTDDPLFKDTAILFIHDSSLDSILNGSESLQKSGMPLYTKHIDQVIQERLKNGNYSKEVKQIITYAITSKKESHVDIRNALIEYREILQVLNTGRITEDEYNEFGLFYDSSLEQLSDKEAREQLKENARFYKLIFDYHHFNMKESVLDKEFDKKGISLINSGSWNSLDYLELKKSVERKNNCEPIVYLPNEKKKTEEGLTYWEAYDKETAKGRRTLNIIIFNPEQIQDIHLRLKFNQSLKSLNCQLDSKAEMTYETKGKNLILEPLVKENQISYGKIKYKDVKDYEFRILVVPLPESVLEDIKSVYKLPSKWIQRGIFIEKEEATFKINPKAQNKETYSIQEFSQTVKVNLDTCMMVSQEVENPEGELIELLVEINEVQFPIYIKGEAIKPKSITSSKIFKLKRELEADFTYDYLEEEQVLKLYQETQQYYVMDELLELLKLEIKLVEQGGQYLEQLDRYHIQANRLEIAPSILESYEQLIAYYRNNKTLPSLACLTEELAELMRHYLASYLNNVGEIEDGSILIDEQKALNQLGIMNNVWKKEVYWSPLHPINIAYELQRYDYLGREEIDEQILRKIKPFGMVNYIKDEHDKLLKAKECSNMMWLKFIPAEMQATDEKNEIAKIVEKNIFNFISQFNYLFQESKVLPLRINLVNIGEGQEILGGLFRYINTSLKNLQPDEIIPIEVNLYAKAEGKTIFHKISYDTKGTDNLEEQFDLEFEEYNLSLAEYMKIFREKISIFHIEDKQEYNRCHLCFMGMNDLEQVTFRNIDEVVSNIYLGGMVTAPTVYKEHNSYVKTTGLLGMPEDNLTRTIKAVNALAYVGKSNTPYDRHAVLATLVEASGINQNQEAKQHALWTIYLEPKVDFSYFINEDTNIHYIERLYSPNSLDAVTVSNNMKIYEVAIENKLAALGLDNKEDNVKSMITFGNIINGEWLLNLLSSKKSSIIESLHNAPLIAWVSHMLEDTSYVWIPVSLYEFMKTCEDIGIRSKKGILKSKSYERLINDIVWVGFKQEENQQIKLGFYPMNIRKTDKEEGTYKALKENIYEDSFNGKYIRQILIQRALFNLEQLKQEKLFEHELSENILTQEIKNHLLQDQYTLTNEYQHHIGEELNVIFHEVEEINMEKSQQHLVAYVNKKLLWKNEFNVQDTQKMVEKQSFEIEVQEGTTEGTLAPENMPSDISSENKGKEEQEPVRAVSIEESLEQVLPEGRYSVLAYYREVPEHLADIIKFYMKRGIKPYILIGKSEDDFVQAVGNEYEYFVQYVQKQILSLSFDIDLDFNETYITDGQIDDEEFWNELKATSFNCEQYEIEHKESNCNLCVRAGAGTGKTKVMIDRIMYLKHISPAMPLSDIAMITFTNESTMEMRTRLSKRLSAYYEMTQNVKYLKWMDELSSMKISTIHAFSMDLLQQIGDEIGIVNLKIGSFSREKDRLIEQAIDTYSKAYPEEYQNIRYVEQYKIKKLVKEVMSFLDNRAVLLDETSPSIEFGDSRDGYHHLFDYVIHEVNAGLENLKFETGKYEVNDLIKMLRQMTKLKHLNSKIQFKYLMVDEFQDTDEVQVSFIAWLTMMLKATLFVVGDVKQSIYRFRGADYTAFEQLKRSTDITLVDEYITKNYRTDKNLMGRLNELFQKLSEDVDRFEFDEKSYLEATKEGDDPKGLHVERIRPEDSKFAKVRDIYEQTKENGLVCVLCRTNTEVNELVQKLEEMQVPCVAEVKGNFYRHPAVRDFYLLVRALLHEERYDEWVSLEQSVYGKGELTTDKVVNAYSTDKNYVKALLKETEWYQELQPYIQKMQVYPAIKVIREIIENYKPQQEYGKRYYISLLKEDANDTTQIKEVARFKALEYEANLNHLLFILQRNFSDATMSLYRIESFLKRMIATDYIEDTIHLEVSDQLQAIRVMTVHKAKGLEFDTVIIPFTDKKFISYRRNQYMLSKIEDHYELGYRIYSKEQDLTRNNSFYNKLEDEEEQETIGDETRLFYVACTRAKHKLYVFMNDFTYKSNKINSWQDLTVRGE